MLLFLIFLIVALILCNVVIRKYSHKEDMPTKDDNIDDIDGGEV